MGASTVDVWRQGHFLLDVEARKVLPRSINDDNQKAVIISHDCDIARDELAEPLVEVIVARVIASLDGNFTHGKNSRRLHVSASAGGQTLYLEFLATHKGGFQKKKLNKLMQDKHFKFSSEELRVLQVWLASRYRRVAFPDRFNERLAAKKIPDKISKKIVPLGAHLEGIYFDIDQDDELEDSTIPYVLEIYVVYKDDGGEETYEAATNLVLDFRNIFEDAFLDKKTGKWSSVELTFCTEVPDSALSIKTLSRLSRWNADHVSLRATPQQPVPI